jgi:hypothetical protein
MEMEAQIKDIRNSMQADRVEVRVTTDKLNMIKQEIDKLKTRLDRKEEERKVKGHEMSMRPEDAFDEPVHEEIIDEEELYLLKQMKDTKKQYRDCFAHLKEKKIDHANSQQQIDVLKEQLITAFEEWYAAEFETPAAHMVGGFNQSMAAEYQAHGKDVDAAAMDEDQVTFMRAKRKVDTLAKAKKLEKQIGVRK